MHRVCITDCLPAPATIEERELAGLARVDCLLASHHRELEGRVEDTDAIILFHEISLPAEIIRRLRRCKVIVRGGVGYDNVDIAAAAEAGIPVCNVPDYGVDEVADHAMALALALNRGLPSVERSLRRTLTPWDKRAVEPVERLAGRTFGILGLGRIGAATAARAKAFRMNVIACDPFLRPGLEKALDVAMVDFETLLRESDVLSLHTPLTPRTRHVINAETLARMKPTAILVNTSRGAVVDTDAVADALVAKRLFGAGIDVLPVEPATTESKLIRLWQEDRTPPVNLVVTPHTAFYSEAGLLEIRVKSAQEVARALRGERLRNVVRVGGEYPA
ncbi:MAG: C-terminal binding protein [Verrucomicrobiales bacterium]|nr:C-terminal binding protein [Verrucomicrobiales bacterium]